jgi:membrane protease YdiL (CAAX protease family)
VDINNNNSKGVSYTSGFFILLGLALTLTVFVGLVAVGILGSPDAMANPKNASIIQGIQVSSVIFGMFVPAWLTANILNRRPFQLLGYRKPLRWQQAGLVILIVLASLAIAGTLGYLNKLIPVSQASRATYDQLEEKYAEQVAMMLNLKNFGGYIFSLVLMAFLPALCEETLFRGGLQNFLTRATRKPWLSIVIISIFFSAVHFSFYGFLPRLFLGIMLGLIYHYTGNIWLSILAHFFNNALAVTNAYVLTLQGKSIKAAMNDDIPSFNWGIIALPFFIFLIVALKRSAAKDAAIATSPDINHLSNGI